VGAAPRTGPEPTISHERRASEAISAHGAPLGSADSRWLSLSPASGPM
jgi:hypothetical protein